MILLSINPIIFFSSEFALNVVIKQLSSSNADLFLFSALLVFVAAEDEEEVVLFLDAAFSAAVARDDITAIDDAYVLHAFLRRDAAGSTSAFGFVVSNVTFVVVVPGFNDDDGSFVALICDG